MWMIGIAWPTSVSSSRPSAPLESSFPLMRSTSCAMSVSFYILCSPSGHANNNTLSLLIVLIRRIPGVLLFLRAVVHGLLRRSLGTLYGRHLRQVLAHHIGDNRVSARAEVNISEGPVLQVPASRLPLRAGLFIRKERGKRGDKALA